MTHQVHHSTVFMKLIQWFLFAVVLGVSSIILRWALALFGDDDRPFRTLISDGELLIVSVALAGAALSDIASARSWDVVRQVSTFLCVMCIMLSVAFYVTVQREPAKASGTVLSEIATDRERSAKDARTLKILVVSDAAFALAGIVGATAVAIKD